jgi:hypothetical protein
MLFFHALKTGYAFVLLKRLKNNPSSGSVGRRQATPSTVKVFGDKRPPAAIIEGV